MLPINEKSSLEEKNFLAKPLDLKKKKKFRNPAHSAAMGVFNGACGLLVKLGQVRKDANAFGRLLKLGVNTFTVIEIAVKKPDTFAYFVPRIQTTRNLMDAIQTFDCFAGLYNAFSSSKSSEKKNEAKPGTTGSKGKEKDDGGETKIEKQPKKKQINDAKKSFSYIFGVASITVACAGTAFQILDKCKLIDLAKIGLRFAPVPVLGSVLRSGITLGQALTGFSAAGYAGLGLDAVDRLAHAKTEDEKKQALFEVASYTAEVASGVFAIAGGIYLGGGAFIAGSLFLGAVSASFGIASYLNKVAVEERVKAA